MDKTIVNIERISYCFPKLNIAKSGFYNFESDAFNHSATLPFFKKLEKHYARFRSRGKRIWKSAAGV